MKETKRFIKVTVVRHSPGNPTSIMYVATRDIGGFGEASTEFAKIGAATFISTLASSSDIWCTESLEEIYQKLSEVELD